MVGITRYIPAGVGSRKSGPPPRAPGLEGAYSGTVIPCSRCKNEKAQTVENFGVRVTKRNGNVWRGISGVCRACQAASVSARGKVTPKRSPEYHREKNLKKHYGISIQDYAEMLQAQGGVCAGCKQESRARRAGCLRPLFVDHNHETGKIRGLLCMNCNTAIAQTSDDPAVLRSLANYLEHTDG